MPWSPPSVPISGTVITVAFANSIITNGLNWLRQITGGADPGAANLALISTAATTSSWQQVPTAAIATSAVTDAKMANQKTNQVNPIYTTFGAPLTEGSGFYDITSNPGDGPLGATGRWLLNQVRHWNWGADYRWQLTCDMDDAANIYSRSVIGGAGSAWHRMFHSGMDGAGSTIDADLLDGVQGSGYALVAAGVPLNAVVWFPTLADLTAAGASWTRHTAADGRLLVGAGAAGSPALSNPQTFTEATNYGSDWGHSHGSGALTATGGTDASTINVAVQSGAGITVAASNHGHNIGGVGGATGDVGGSTDATVWIPGALRAGIWGRRI